MQFIRASRITPTPAIARALSGRGRLLCGCLALALAGCTLTAPERSGSKPAPAAAPAEQQPAAVDPKELQRLLWAAEDAIAEDHLTYPAAGSALLLYDQVLNLDPGNMAARRGLEVIVERFLSRAHEATERGQFEQARIQLDRARAVDPDHPGIEPAEARIRLLSAADRHVLRLDAAALGARSEALGRELAQLGDEVREPGCRARIHARNDAEGRWLYHQLSGAPGSERIRTELHIGAPPRIEVLCIEPE